jgi:hypothetical protein
MGKFFQTKSRRIAAIGLLLVACYALAGFVLLPRLVRAALLEDIPKKLGVTASVGEIRINPFLLTAEVRNFSLAAPADPAVPAGSRLVGFDRLYVAVAFASLWRRELTFNEIELDAPSVNAIVAPDGTLNLLRLQPKPDESQAVAEQPPGSLPRLRIAHFKLADGAVSYEDRSRPTQFATRLQPLSFDLRDFTTEAESGLFTMSGVTQLGEHFEWSGHLGVQPIASNGVLHVAGLRALTIADYLAGQFGFSVGSGLIDIDARYTCVLRNAPECEVDVSRFAVTDLAIAPSVATAPWIVLPSLTVTNTRVDVVRRSLNVDSVAIAGLKLSTWLEADGSLNLSRLAASPVPATPAASSVNAANPVSAKPVASAAPDAPWAVALADLTLRDAEISFEDRSVQPAAKLLLGPLALELKGASLDLTQAVDVHLDTQVNGTGQVALNGNITPRPLAAEIELKVANLRLEALQPYIHAHSTMTLADGRLTARANVRLGALKPAVKVTGNVTVEKLHTIDDTLHADFLNWKRLEVRGIDFQRGPDRLAIERIALIEPYARVSIEQDASLNAKRIFAGRAGDAPVTGPVAKPSARALPISVRQVDVQGGETDFSDLSIVPNFAAGIHALHGSVRGLSSQPASRARVDLQGQVDAFSPVAISGEVNLLSPALYTDLALSFRNMELSIFNPYSGKFAGYAISKGKLTTELAYKIDGGHLDAKHHVIIDQLEFGDKTPSKDAVTLPVKLAVALLKDRNGVIDLNFPVGGSLDDPHFKLGPVVWQVVKNLLVKAVTAPFALLGSLFGGGPDLQYIDFQPGSFALDSAGAEKIAVIVKALKERPQLKLEVPIVTLRDLDASALAEDRFRRELDAEPATAPPAARAPAVVPYTALAPAARLKRLTALYVAQVGQAPVFPTPPEKPDPTPARVQFLEAQLRSQVLIDAAALKTLGEARALALQTALLTDSGIDPARVFLVANDKVKAQAGLVRVELSLQ